MKVFIRVGRLMIPSSRDALGFNIRLCTSQEETGISGQKYNRIRVVATSWVDINQELSVEETKLAIEMGITGFKKMCCELIEKSTLISAGGTWLFAEK